jgi:hypothetical protein
MAQPRFDAWLNTAPLALIGATLLGAMCAAALIGYALRRRRARAGRESSDASDQAQLGYIVSAIMALLALLLSFTFSLAVERYMARRELVLEEANAIGSAYLRAQLLGPPHRERISRLLVQYADNRIALARATPGTEKALLATNNRLLAELGAATTAAFDSVQALPISISFVDGMNAVIDMDAARKTARVEHVPSEVVAVLMLYLIGTSGALGRVLIGPMGRVSAGFLMLLFTLSLLLVIDIDRPTIGGLREKQQPMESLLNSFAAQPPPAYDRWRGHGEPGRS